MLPVLYRVRYLYMDPGKSISASAPPADLILQPRLGARMHGSVVLSGPAMSLRDSLVGAKVLASGHHDSLTRQTPGPVERSARLSPSLEFEFNALPSSYLYDVLLDPSDLAGVRRLDLVVEGTR